MAEAGALADTAAVMRANGGYNYGYPAPMYGGFGGGFGMDAILPWIFALFAMSGGFGGFGMGGFGGLGGLGLGGLGGGLIGYGMGTNATKTDLSDGLTSLQTANKIDNVSTQIGNGFANAATQLCGGLADVTAAVTNGTNNINTGMLTGFANSNLANCQNTSSLIRAIDQNGFMQDKCCCDIKTQIAAQTTENFKNTAALQAQIANSDNQAYRNKCDIENAIKQQGELTRALIEQNEVGRLKEQLAFERQQVQNARLDASQAAQTQQIINQLQPVSRPAYITASPYQSLYPFNGYNNGFGSCGCGYANQFIN